MAQSLQEEWKGKCGQRSEGFGSSRGFFLGAGGLIAMIWSARLLFSSKYGALVTTLHILACREWMQCLSIMYF